MKDGVCGELDWNG